MSYRTVLFQQILTISTKGREVGYSKLDKTHRGKFHGFYSHHVCGVVAIVEGAQGAVYYVEPTSLQFVNTIDKWDVRNRSILPVEEEDTCVD